MTDVKKILRTLIVLSVILTVAQFVIYFAEVSHLSPASRAYWEQLPVRVSAGMAGSVLGIYFAALMGLFLFKDWARILFLMHFLAYWLLTLLNYSFGEVSDLIPAWSLVLYDVVLLINGAILAIVFWPDVFAGGARAKTAEQEN